MTRPELTPCSSGDFMRRLRDAVADLDRADRDLHYTWEARNHASWPRHSTNLKDMVPRDEPALVAAEAKVEEAQAAWRSAHAKFVEFAAAPLALICAVEDWRKSQWSSRPRCTLAAGHGGQHSFFEAEPIDSASPSELATRGPATPGGGS